MFLLSVISMTILRVSSYYWIFSCMLIGSSNIVSVIIEGIKLLAMEVLLG